MQTPERNSPLELLQKNCLPERQNCSGECYGKEAGCDHLEHGSEADTYKPPTKYLFVDEKRKLVVLAKMKKQIGKLDLTKEDLGFVNI